MRGFFRQIVLAGAVALAAAGPSPMTKDDLERLQIDLNARFDTFTRPDSPNDPHPLIATAVRLAFHDCAESPTEGGAGICDGCIHADNEENVGLEYGAVYPLEQVFQNSLSVSRREGGEYNFAGAWTGNPSGSRWASFLSRADFWQLAGLLAIERGNDIAYEQHCDGTVGPTSSEIVQMQPIARAFGDVTNIKYYTGRQDCPGGTPFSSGLKLTTNPFWNFEDVHNFFVAAFPGYTKQDSVAIMGAHTLGRAHAAVPTSSMDPATNCCGGTGFDGSWKVATDTWTHEYYVDSYFITWEQVRSYQNWDDTINPDIDRSRDKRQYKHDPSEVGSEHQGLMLNTDMVLYYDVLTEDTTTGEEMCSVYDLMFLKEDPNSIPPPCVAPNDFLQPHQEGDLYHQFDAMWKEDFWVAWEKMTTNGYRLDQLSFYEKRRPAWTEMVHRAATIDGYEVWGFTEESCDLQRLHSSSEGSFTLSNKQAYVLVYSKSEPNEEMNREVTFDVYAWLGWASPHEQQHHVEQFAKYIEQYGKTVYLDPHGTQCRGRCREFPTPEQRAQWAGLWGIFRMVFLHGDEDDLFQRRFSRINVDIDGPSVAPSCPKLGSCHPGDTNQPPKHSGGPETSNTGPLAAIAFALFAGLGCSLGAYAYSARNRAAAAREVELQSQSLSGGAAF